MGMFTEELAEQGTSVVFCSEDGATELTFPAIVAVYVARAANVVNAVYEIEELYMVAMESFQKFSSEMMSLAGQIQYAFRTDERWHFKDCLRVNRSLASLFTVLRMYSENVKKLFSVSEEKSRHLFMMPGYRELDALRNYMQHVSFLPLRRNVSCALYDPKVALSSCRFELAKEKMLLGEISNPRTKSRIQELLGRDTIDVYELVMDGMAAFRRIHQIVRQTRCFSDDYAACARFLCLLKGMRDKTGLGQYRLLKDKTEIAFGKSYFYTSTISMIAEMREISPTETVYPSDKIYPTLVPQPVLDRYNEANPMKVWHKEAMGCLAEYDALLKEYSLSDVPMDMGLDGIDKLCVKLEAIDKEIVVNVRDGGK